MEDDEVTDGPLQQEGLRRLNHNMNDKLSQVCLKGPSERTKDAPRYLRSSRSHQQQLSDSIYRR
jgi:hypothetical protein